MTHLFIINPAAGSRDRTEYYSQQIHAVCGAKGCTRACMIAMEKRGVLKNKFEKPFRRKSLWSVDWSKYADGRDETEEKTVREPD